MDTLEVVAEEVQQGRSFTGYISQGTELVGTLADFCRDHSIFRATMRITGSLCSATLAVLDQTQQVYATRRVEGDLELVSCTGQIIIRNDAPYVRLHAMMTDCDGNIHGGRIYKDSIVYSVDFILAELLDAPMHSRIDPFLGWDLWGR